MPKAKVKTPLTDKEIKFAHLLLAGELTDPQAASAAGLKTSTAAFHKAKPEVQAYMAEHRQMVSAAVAKHEAKTLIKFEITTPQLLQRLWEIANLDPETTKGSMSAQVLAIKELLDRVSGKAGGKPDEEDDPKPPEIYTSRWLRGADRSRA